MGDPDRLHSYSYTPDVAAGLVTLGTDPSGRRGRSGTSPSPRRGRPARSSSRSTPSPATKPRCFAAGRTTLRLFGLVKPAMREYLHTLYQFTDDWVVSDARFRATFGDRSTPLDDALAATLEWYRQIARSVR